MNGREPYLSAAQTLLDESGCTVTAWRKKPTGVAHLRSRDWEIEVPEPRGPVSYATLAHEVGHQMLHRPGLGRRRQRWQEELEAWEYALDSFERFGLPGIEQARADAVKCMRYAISKALRRTRTPDNYCALRDRIADACPEWVELVELRKEVNGMAKVIVQTDGGDEVWRMENIESWQISGLTCPGNTSGSSVAAGVRRAVRDAEVIQAGGDPERPSEKAMRLAMEKRERAAV